MCVILVVVSSVSLAPAVGLGQGEPSPPTGTVVGQDIPPEEGPAPITVSVGPGERALDPVAVPAAACNAAVSVCSTVTSVIARDLTLSGFFRVVDPESYIADMSFESLTQTKWEDWFNVGAKYLIKVHVDGSGKGSFLLSFRLYDVNQKKGIQVDYEEAAVSEGSVRTATHKFVNEVIRAITGMPGPFGGKILFAAKTGHGTKGVYMMDVDGYGKSTIAGGDTVNMLPSMVGGTTVYTSFKPGYPAVYVGGKRVSPEGRPCRGARLSPDGSVLAVSMDDGGQSDIFLVSLDGEILKNLTSHWADEVSPTWSPDGSQIAFVSNRTGSPQIYMMGRDGGGATRLTMAGGYNSTPDFGTGGIVVFAGMDEAHSDIFTVDLQSNIARITQDQGSNRDPTISPDGRHLAFISNREGKTRIWISTIDGRYQFPITEKSGSYSTLFWAR